MAGVEGLDNVLRNLNREIEGIEDRSVEGLFAGGLIIEGTAVPRAPRDTGNLRGSSYTRKAPGNPQAVEVGFGAAYALPVHEDLEARHEDGEAKFLESAVRDREQDVVDEVAARAKVRD